MSQQKKNSLTESAIPDLDDEEESADLQGKKPRKIKPVQREAVLKIVRYAGDGVSIAYDNEKVVFVRYAMAGETVRVNIYKEAKDYAMAEPLEIIDVSPDRKTPPCQYFAMCGGCDYQMLDYEAQLAVKKQLVIETFRRIGKIELPDLTGVIRSPKPFGYRNTETFKVNPRAGKIGFFRKDTKSVIDVQACLLAMDGINAALADVKVQALFPEHNFKVRSTLDNDTVVHWVPTEKYEDRPVYEKVQAAGRSIRFKISKDSFFQVNDYVVPLWLEKIISFLDPDGHERIFDLYCGIGLITLFVSYFARETIGVEISKSSVKDAKHNVEINGIDTNVQFIEADVDGTLSRLGHADVMIIDPPRKGMDRPVLDVLLQMAPAKIIYSSCKPATMARDIQLLGEKYELSEIHLVDMFPQTHHVEMLALLKLKK
jgi:23S rRNA (uracil1939-C5)-methyltransferase